MNKEIELIDDGAEVEASGIRYRDTPGTRIGIDLERECVYWPNGTKSEFMRIALGKSGVTARERMKFRSSYKPVIPRGGIYAFPSRKNNDALALSIVLAAIILVVAALVFVF